jgi:UDP-3-O-[3-hydroxymyristoyl] N-acetylglucosamine deacetylase
VQQSTIARRVAWSGTGLHSGEEVEIALCPAGVGTGIMFASLGGAQNGGDVEIPARAEAVLSTSRATTLAAPRSQGEGATRKSHDPRISTVEHLLAVLFALEIDNVRIEVRGSEVPVMDGSAAPFVDCVRLAGREIQNAERCELAIVEPLEIRDRDRWIRIEPAEGLRISYAIDFAHPCIGRQCLEIPFLDEKTFERELAAARTFGFAHEVEALHSAGLARGGSFDNSVVLDETGILNAGGPRWPDEFVRHKVIDLLGDLALLGAALHAHVQVEKGGHRLHHRLVRALLDRPDILVRTGPVQKSTPQVLTRS